jgi:hypothetical protein
MGDLYQQLATRARLYAAIGLRSAGLNYCQSL